MWEVVNLGVITLFLIRFQDYPDVCTVPQRKLKAISCQNKMNYVVYM